MTRNLPLPFDAGDTSPESGIDARDRQARERAVDPRLNVALEASAGTGKTRVLVDRYVNLLRAGVDPANVLAITFTRKAAAEMRERILTVLRSSAQRGEIPPARWRELRDRTPEIAISTIDAFCLSLLREFPLEADLDPGFSVADETEIPRLVDESLDRALRICRSAARHDEDIALVFAQLGNRRARAGMAALLSRRTVAPAVLTKYLTAGPQDWDVNIVANRGASALLDVFNSMRGGLDAFLDTGPLEPAFLLLARHLRAIDSVVRDGLTAESSAVQAAFARAREHFLTQDGQPRARLGYSKAMFASVSDWERHKDLVIGHAARLSDAFKGFRRDLNVLVSRGVWRMFQIAEREYRRTLEAHAALDFSDLLLRALLLLRQMEEFAQSRYRLESRYHHVLVDEFQDTSRAQWELISLLIESWGHGSGLAHTGPLEPSIFIVGDRKQSIYGFRDADAAVLEEAARHLTGLRAGGEARCSISRSFRSAPALLAFVNDVCGDINKAPQRRDAFRYEEGDRFPTGEELSTGLESLGILVGDSPEACAEGAANEIARLIREGTEIRDRETGLPRPATPGDIAILFRTRESHREYEDALDRRGIRSYVYKGLGFFDADEIKDLLGLFWYLADPLSDRRAAAWMRSRFVRISDEGLRRLAPRLADALIVSRPETRDQRPEPLLDEADQWALAAARTASARWRSLVDRMPPAELLDLILQESAYAFEMRGPRYDQARENVKKFRALVRRIQNRGYATLARIAEHLDRLAVGDEANAVIDARDAVNLMTVHASKGLEFPIVFVVNLSRGTGNRRDPIRVGTDGSGEVASVAVGDYQSEFDEDEPERDREETKRLLYVALTRARDRLYVGSSIKDGRIQPGRGSLAEILPESFLEQFNQALGGATSVEWKAASGSTHTLRVCAMNARVRLKPDTTYDIPTSVAPTAVAPTADAPMAVAPTAVAPTVVAQTYVAQTYVVSGFSRTRTMPNEKSPGQDDFATIEDSAPRRLSALAVAMAGRQKTDDPHGDGADRLVGTLVHRLFERVGFGEAGLDRLRMVASGLLRSDEAADLANRTRVVDRAVTTYSLMRNRADLCDLYQGGEALHEVPFTMDVGGEIVRGSIDCLVRTGADRFTVLEFKTGRPRLEHETQSGLYRRAVELTFPGSQVAAWIVYPGEVVDA